MLGGVLAGLGGAYFTLESVPHFEPLMTNGRGFIALAAMIFGKWTPLGAWGAALLFGLTEALPVALQIQGFAVPYQLVGHAAVRADHRGRGRAGRAGARAGGRRRAVPQGPAGLRVTERGVTAARASRA